MKKLVFGIVLVAIATVAFASCAQLCPTDDFEVEYVGGGRSLRITNYVGDNRDVRIPPRIRGLPVTHIGEVAFQGRTLASVMIPRSVIYIEYAAFADNQLTSITIPSSVTIIWHLAFAHNQLTNITIPNSVTYIGHNAFWGNPLTTVTIPMLTQLGYYVFNPEVIIIHR